MLPTAPPAHLWHFPIQFRFAVGLILAMHIFGFGLMCWPPTRTFFIALTPVNLLVSAGFLYLFQWTAVGEVPPNGSLVGANGQFFWVAALCMYAGGFLAEVAGVQTGAIFGQYAYGQGLGPKIWGTPLVIGVNWFILICTSTSLCETLRWPLPAKIAAAAALMVAMDGLIEPVAIHLGFWNWFGQPIPLQNYGAWVVISLLLIGLFHRLGAVRPNPIAPFVLGAQIFFFVGHNIVIWWG